MWKLQYSQVNYTVVKIMSQLHVYLNLHTSWYTIASYVELVSKELNHLAAILHVYAGGLNFMK